MRANTKTSSAITKREMLSELRQGLDFPPVRFRIVSERKPPTTIAPPDMIVEAAWGKKKFRFAAILKARSTPRCFQEAVNLARQAARSTGKRVMIVSPYLRDSQLEQLEQLKISGIDLSGNGLIIVPEKLFIMRVGNRNRFVEPVSTKYAYRGTTSLIPRVFLCRATYRSLAEIQQEIAARGANVALSTVSKSLRRLEEDLIVQREPGRIHLIQPDALLDRLAENYRAPKCRRDVTCATDTPLAELCKLVPPGVRIALSGQTSIDAYAVMGRDQWPVIMTNSVDSLLERWTTQVQPTSRFVNLEIRETEDPLVFFDIRIKDGVPYASPVQVYIEYAAGDKRDQETAIQVREQLLANLS